MCNDGPFPGDHLGSDTGGHRLSTFAGDRGCAEEMLNEQANYKLTDVKVSEGFTDSVVGS